MNVNFQTDKQDDGTYTVTIMFTDIPDERQAIAAGNLVKRALMTRGAVGFTGDNPLEKPRRGRT